MSRHLLPTVLLASALANALPNLAPRQVQGVDWIKCEFDFSVPEEVFHECGTLTVPLDYADSTVGTIDLNLVKMKASKGPAKGSMLFNPGGPGESGIEAATSFVQNLQIASGGVYDIIGFDPRGTGRTIPMDCSKQASVETRDERFFTQDMATVVEQAWPGYVQTVANCSAAQPEFARYQGTTFVARDMLSIVDALEPDGMLRYYGVSYGTLLGWTFAAMFPERVDRMILDANMNPFEYWNGVDITSTADTDAEFVNILEACFEAGESCPLMAHGDTNTVLEKLKTIIEVLASQDPIENYPGLPPGALLTVPQMKKILFTPLYMLNDLQSWASLINMLVSEDPSKASFAELAQVLGTPPPTEPVPEPPAPGNDEANAPKWAQHDSRYALLGIRCGDWPLRITDPSELEGLLEQMRPTSSWTDTIASDALQCVVWPFEAAERYTGNFTAAPAHPVLFVNPTWDPVTPLSAAKNASTTFEGSVVLEHRGNGHSSMAQASLCSMKYMQQYMVDGTLPAEDTVCEVDMPLWTTMDKEARLLKQQEIWSELIDASGAIRLPVDGNGTAGTNGSAGTAANGTSTSADGAKGAASSVRASMGMLAGLLAAMAFFM